MAISKYRKYFDIKKQYYPCVKEELIRKGEVDWKDFYPHPTFVNLIETAADVIERKKPLGIWVEGGYGTGKSHAAFTLSSLLHADRVSTEEYFDKYKLDSTLKKRFCALKERKDEAGNLKKIVTVHNYGTSSISNDADLCFVMQQSIMSELEKEGCSYYGESTLKEATLAWLGVQRNKNYFDDILQDSAILRDYTSEKVIEHLNTFTGEQLVDLMGKIAQIGKDNGIEPMKMDVKIFIAWLRDIISGNNLQELFYIWDEFTKYFDKNIHDLTGFQEIVEVSETDNFCFLIVTHAGKSDDVFKEGGSDKKIKNRFVEPICSIDLPENIAFKLIGHALTRSKDEVVANEFKEIIETQYQDTADSRKMIMDKLNSRTDADVTDEDMMNILPIHPYTALILKYIASSFQENTRSMFAYIKNDTGEKLKDFQWYIDNYGPYTAEPYVTIDMLWDYFYQGDGKFLRYEIKNILSAINNVSNQNLDSDYIKILKTVLLMQAISYMNGDAVECFYATEKNLNLAFEGTNIGKGAANIADKLRQQDILFQKTMGGKQVYVVKLVATTTVNKAEVEAKWTSAKLIQHDKFADALVLPGALKLRFNVFQATQENLSATVRKIRTQPIKRGKYNLLCIFAKTDEEAKGLYSDIENLLMDEKNEDLNLTVVDASLTPFGIDRWNRFIDYHVQSESFAGNDNAQRDKYNDQADDVIAEWKKEIGDRSAFIICRKHEDKVSRERRNSIDDLYEGLKEVVRADYKYAPELMFDLIDNMYIVGALKQGVKSAVNGKTEGTFNAPAPKKKLEKALEGAWGMPAEYRYWEEKPHLPISQIKEAVEKVIKDEFDKSDRVAISTIYNCLAEAPFGYLPCNLTAFILGYVLKEYADPKYTYDDGVSGGTMNLANLQAMVEWIVKYEDGTDTRNREKYIVTMTDDVRFFNELTCKTFNIDLIQCTNIPNTRNLIRNRMKELTFPVWCLEYCLDGIDFKCDKEDIRRIIRLYSGIANNVVLDEAESKLATDIGALYAGNADLAEDIQKLFTAENCRLGMTIYLKTEKTELVSLATEIDDDGQYINAVKRKFDADSANWVWLKETADIKIDEVIVEYSIIAESNKIVGKAKNYREALDNWKTRCGNIRISYSAAKNYLGAEGEFIGALYDLKNQGSLLDSQKKEFLRLIREKGHLFDEFYKNQLALFVKICNVYVGKFAAEEQSEIFTQIPSEHSFTKEKQQYLQEVERVVGDYEKSLGRLKLRRLWTEKTDSDSPADWSNKNLTPIMCMVDEADYSEAKATFATVGRAHPEEGETEKAIAFLEKATFYDAMKNKKRVDEAFEKNVLKDYAVLLGVDEARQYLKERASADPIEWFGNPLIDKLIIELATNRYDIKGSAEATDIVDAIDDINTLKEYLKKLIQDDMSIGIGIIKNNKK